uniref:L51_S25_CI-B8 domain-containing protein n=1 Tax=Steinernema glaseri TaxID=37863 RepID=A0A1I8AL51_9BILA
MTSIQKLPKCSALYAAARANGVMGIILALYDREHTGKGQILDVSLTENIAYVQRVARTSRLGIPPAFNRFYACKDGKCVAVGLKDPKEQEDFLKKLGVSVAGKDAEKELINVFKSKKQKEWLSLFKDSGSVTPLLSNEEAAHHKHHKERHFFELDKTSNSWSAKPVPRFPKNRS